MDINIPVVKKIEQARAAEKAAAEAAAREREEERRGGKETNSIEEGAGKKDMRRSDEVKRSPSVPRHVGVERAMRYTIPSLLPLLPSLLPSSHL